jgi:hypothetical protein
MCVDSALFSSCVVVVKADISSISYLSSLKRGFLSSRTTQGPTKTAYLGCLQNPFLI